MTAATSGRFQPGSMPRAGLLAALGLGLLLSPDVAAQDLIDQRQSVREREQLEFQQRLRSLQRQPLRPAVRHADTPHAPLQSATGRCWHIQGLRVAGNSLIPQARISQALLPHLSPCMDTEQINRVLATLTALYAQDGYIASRPQLRTPPADRQPLDILLSEGFVEAIEVSDRSLPLSLRSAFGELLGKPLQLRTLERGLEQLNRLQSFDLTADIEPGEAIGASRIVIRPNSRPPRWGLGATLNNAGKPNIGRYQAQLSASLDSPLQLNDFVHLSGNQTLDAAPALSRSLGLYYALPYQAWMLSFNANQSEYRLALPVSLGQPRDTYGNSTLMGIGLERSLWRDAQRVLSTTLRLDHKRTEAFLDDRTIDIQSPRLLNAEAGLSLLWIQSGIWTGYLGYARGLSDWDGRDYSAIVQPGSPRGRFSKWRGSLGYLGQHQWAGLAWQWHSQGAWQYSTDPLPPIEQQLLTDEYAVRGLRDLSLSGNTAASWRNSLSVKLPLGGGWTLEPQLGADLGWRRIEPWQRNTPDPFADTGQMGAASAGITLAERHTRLTLDYQRNLYLRNATVQPGYWRLELSLKL